MHTPPSTTRLLLLLPLLLTACEGDRGPQGPPGSGGGGGGSTGGGDDPTNTKLERGEAAPGLSVTILALGGASGPDGDFRVGDHVSVDFVLSKDDGEPWRLEEMVFGRAHVSGPTVNYQRVLPEQEDVVGAATLLPAGGYRYTFRDPLPPAYAAPYHDTDAFGELDGELTGQPLQAGTYTLGLSFGWEYSVAGEPFLDVGEAARDFLFGGATILAPRLVTDQAHCDRCHTELTAHRGERRQLVQCLMCHTSGAEDANLADVGEGTPGVTIDSRVLFHKIHDASHLPSVLGIGVNADGSLDYEREARPLLVATEAGELRDFSSVGFPAWPNRTIPMLRDFMYSQLSPQARAKEDAVLRGVTACAVCHGDPDGDGPLEAPLDGDLIFAQPSRKACGACHDDIDWTRPYATNGQVMPPQSDSSRCKNCHEPDMGPISVRTAHRHPLENPDLISGLELEMLGVIEAGQHDGDGRFEAGEGMALSLRLRDGSGQAVGGDRLEALEVSLSGPTTNSQLIHVERIPSALLRGAQPFSVELPERIHLEHVGDSTAALGDQFTTVRASHLNLDQAPTRVWLRAGLGSAETNLVEPTSARSNFLPVADGQLFERDDIVVVEDGIAGREEYLRLQRTETGGLWLGSIASGDSPAYLRFDHPAGSSVRIVQLVELVEGVHYSLHAPSGRLTEEVEFGTGRAVLADYSAPFRMPAFYGPPLNDSPTLGPSAGEWTGLALTPGTYTLTARAWYEEIVNFAVEENVYAVASRAVSLDLLVGDATLPEPYDLVTAASCRACHQELRFHGGTAVGFESCISCHGTAGAEDRPQYVAANAPATEGVSVSFRDLVHRIHSGGGLDQNQSFLVVGESDEPWPDNFSLSNFDAVRFPATPGGVLQCAKCHGPSSATWQLPEGRDHPSGQPRATAAWALTCLGCHDSPSARAHADSQTSPSSGVEACAICHAPSETWAVELFHETR